MGMAMALFLSAGCSTEDNVYEQPPTLPDGGPAPSQGWVWTGEGEQPNFATADMQCRRITVASDPRLAGQVEGQQRGTTTRVRIRDSDRRAYWRCLHGRGWNRADTELR